MKGLPDIWARDVLIHAIAIEKKNARDFEDWSYRFLPYNVRVSLILQEMTKEEIEHQEILETLFTEMFHEKAPDIEPAEMAIYQDSSTHSDFEHFFVVGHAMARNILEIILLNETTARQFYERAAQQTSEPDLVYLYNKLASFEADHETRIQEHIENITAKQTA